MLLAWLPASMSMFMAFATPCFAVPAFAQAGSSVPVNRVPIGTGIDMAMAAGV